MLKHHSIVVCCLILVSLTLSISFSVSETTTNEEPRRLQEDLQSGISNYFKHITSDVTAFTTSTQVKTQSSSSADFVPIELKPMDLKLNEVASRYIDTDLGDKNLIWSLRGSHTAGMCKCI